MFYSHIIPLYSIASVFGTALFIIMPNRGQNLQTEPHYKPNGPIRGWKNNNVSRGETYYMRLLFTFSFVAHYPSTDTDTGTFSHFDAALACRWLVLMKMWKRETNELGLIIWFLNFFFLSGARFVFCTLSRITASTGIWWTKDRGKIIDNIACGGLGWNVQTTRARRMCGHYIMLHLGGFYSDVNVS